MLHTKHKTAGDTGEYFYFAKSTWVETFGAAPNGSPVYVTVKRNGEAHWKGNVVVWDSDNGVHGRRAEGAGANQWTDDDVIFGQPPTEDLRTAPLSPYTPKPVTYHEPTVM